MKIPTNVFLAPSEALKIIEQWKNAAREISMRTGVFVRVDAEYLSMTVVDPRPTRIYFEALDHEFESLQDLERALKLKAFA